MKWLKRLGWMTLGAWIGMHIGAWAADERTWRRPTLARLARTEWVRWLADDGTDQR